MDESDILLRHGNIGRIEFHYVDGELWWTYVETEDLPTTHHTRAFRFHKAYGRVPQDVQGNGDDAVHQFASRERDRIIADKKSRMAEWDKFLQNPNVPVVTMYEGVELKGRIVSVEDTALKIRLEEPVVGTDFVIFSWAAAMQGKVMFDKSGSFSEYTMARARDLLVRIFQREVKAGARSGDE